MDPNATIQALNDALDNADWQDAIEHSDNLINWLEKGGFIPSAFMTDSRDHAIRMAKALRDEAMRGTLRD